MTAETAPDGGKLSRYQLDMMRVLAREGPTYGLDIKRHLEQYYDEKPTHGRYSPNLDILVEAGLVTRQRDGRTNRYALTADGKELVRRVASQWGAAVMRMERKR